MKKIIGIICALMLALGLCVLVSAPAEAKNASCISKSEYKKIRGAMTRKQVKRIVGSWGRTLLDIDLGYYEDQYDWVTYEDHYGEYDAAGNYVGYGYGDYDADGNYLEPTSYEVEELVGYEWSPNRDSFVTFKKCSSWTGKTKGKRGVAMNFDDYTYAPASGMRLYGKLNYIPRAWVTYLGARTTDKHDVRQMKELVK